MSTRRETTARNLDKFTPSFFLCMQAEGEANAVVGLDHVVVVALQYKKKQTVSVFVIKHCSEQGFCMCTISRPVAPSRYLWSPKALAAKLGLPQRQFPATIMFWWVPLSFALVQSFSLSL